MSDSPARVAERPTAADPANWPKPPKKSWRGLIAAIASLLLLVWAFTGVQVNVQELIEGAPRMADNLGRMWPPDVSMVLDLKSYDIPEGLSPAQLFLPVPLDADLARDKAYWWSSTFPNSTVLGATLQTIQMAFAGTFLALIVALPISFLAARNTTPLPAVYHAIKLGTNFFRTIPDFAVALVLVAAIGLGPFPGTLALAFHTATVLIKLFAEAIEGIDEGVVEALDATGARYMQKLSFAVLPQVMPAFISFVLYRFETNIRAAAVLGVIGAGGIGTIMTTSFRMFQYQEAAMTVLVLIILVMTVDYLSARLRRMVT